jgi:hypothetical protein
LKPRFAKIRQDDDEDAPAGVTMEGFVRIASIHFASSDSHPPIPLGEDEEGNEQEYKLNLIFGNQHGA